MPKIVQVSFMAWCLYNNKLHYKIWITNITLKSVHLSSTSRKRFVLKSFIIFFWTKGLSHGLILIRKSRPEKVNVKNLRKFVTSFVNHQFVVPKAENSAKNGLYFAPKLFILLWNRFAGSARGGWGCTETPTWTCSNNDYYIWFASISI